MAPWEDLVEAAPRKAGQWVIACSKRGDPRTTLFMVDRRKQWGSFWSDRLTDVFIYTNRGAAESKAASLKYNTPRVLTLDEARDIADSQSFNRAMRVRERYEATGQVEPPSTATYVADQAPVEREGPEGFQAPPPVDARWDNIMLPEEDDT
jgi:hypothetical protein